MANRPPRADYDAVAPLYDSQPGRARAVDPEFLAFLAQRAAAQPLSALDIGCGTGNQLVANRTAAPSARLVGIDRSAGMLRQARPKAPDIAWVLADAALLPFPARSFDFISCQFAFHHFRKKAGMLREAFRVLRSGGRFVLRNLCPQESADWLCYRYFPEARIVDLQDFWPPEAVMAVMEGAGFTAVTADYEHLRREQTLSAIFEIVRRRDTCSQLLAIPDTAYEAGVRRVERELTDGSAPQLCADHLCLLTIRGDKPKGKSIDGELTTDRHPVMIRPAEPADAEWIGGFLRARWGAGPIVVHGEAIEAAALPALIAESRRGLATYRRLGCDAELVTLDAVPAGIGTGTALVEALAARLRAEGCARLWLTMTNANLPALRFYQRRGFRLMRVRPGAVDAARRLKPSIPTIGAHGIPIRDELDLCRALDADAAEGAPLPPWSQGS